MNIQITEMKEEDLDQMLLEADHLAKCSGFENNVAMQNFKFRAIKGMIKFGGNFAHYLGHALANADTFNSAKIISAFRDVCEEHAELWIKSISKI